jgi:heat shock protein HslJ
MVAGRVAVVLVLAAGTAGAMPATAADPGFPYAKELLLDAKPMKGSKRVPILTVEPGGATTIDLWCDSVSAQLVVSGAALTITPGVRSGRQCDPARMKGDDDLLEALAQATTWRRDGAVLTLTGARTLRFRAATN